MLQIRLLGQFNIRTEGKRVTIPSRAGQSLLAYLALTAGTPHRREKLAGIFWPDTTDENARKNLRQELWRIRKAISAGQPAEKEFLLADEITLKFNREAEYWLDVSQMERPDLDLQSLIANLSLYQGELLPGFYDEWITLERERIQAVFEARMEQLLEQLITAERWIAVQEWGERWLTLSGVREPAYRALMLASGVRGDMAKVASLYQRCTAELQENLGVEPSAETRALYDGLLKGAKTPPRTAAQPSGTITFLFTDIEGSTRLLEMMGDQYAVALGEHHEILRAAIQKWNGREVDTQGDAFFVTFTRAIDAVRCAAEAQLTLAAHTWHQDETLRVRMGLHTGEPLIASTGYVGMDVHRAARIGDAGHGGQILLSQTTRELVIQDLPQGMTIRDLGEHRLKDMKYPSSIYQLVVDGLPAEFAPIRTKFTGTESPTPGEAPFKGLQFFDEGDSDLFFGRETLTIKLMNRLRDANFLSVIIGASGSGKSSLVRAGLVPALKRGGALISGTKLPEGSANWQVHIITPTAHPLEALAIELTRDSESVTAAATLVDDLSKDPRSLHFFLSRQTQPHHTLLVIDQFEELFTLCRDEFEREAFIDNLLAALTPAPLPLGEMRKGEGNITLIVTLRADFYAHLAQYPELRDAVAQQQEYIGPMTSEELRRAIEEPARRGHWEFEPGLVDLILRDVGDEPGALPLLSHALLETWKRRAGHMLTLKGYADAGGVHGAIAHTAESVYQNLSLNEQVIVRNILLRLTEFGEGTEDTRRRASFAELMSHAEDAEDVRAVLNTLAEARLVTLSEDTAEVAHEALIREWPQLREWLSQDREGIILHRHLTEAAHEWELLERDTGSLYRGARLAQANEWSALNPNTLNAQEKMFLDASNRQAKQEEQEREDQLQRELDSAKELAETQSQSASRLRTRNRVITTVGSIAVILAMLTGMLGLQSNQNAITAQDNAATAQVAKDNALNAQATAEAERLRAEKEKQLAMSREWAAAAVSNIGVDSDRSILLALQAVSVTYEVDNGWTREAEEALHRTVSAQQSYLALRGHASGVNDVAFSPDGALVATASLDGTAKVWDAATGKELLMLHPTGASADTPGKLYTVAFRPDGKQLAIGGEAGVIILWSVTTGEELLSLHEIGEPSAVFALAFSPDGARLAAASADGTVRVWELATSQVSLALSINITPPPDTFTIFNIHDVAFSPNGTRLATVGPDKTAKVWDAVTGEELFTLAGHKEAILALAYSPDGTRIATASYDATTKVWDAETGAELLTLSGNASRHTGVAFNADGTRLAIVSDDGTAKVWDASAGQLLFTLSGHSNAVRAVAFSPDGTRIATASDDATARIWLAAPSRDLFTLTGHTQQVYGGHFSPDGTRLVTSSTEGKTKVWDALTGQLLYTLSLPSDDSINAGAFSPDGKLIATGGGDQLARIWDAATGRLLLTLRGHERNVFEVKFSPDGTRLATASPDTTAKLWDVATGKELLTLSGHAGRVFSLDFSPDGTRLITGGEDDVAIVWDLATGQPLLRLPMPTGVNFGVSFSPDGTRLLTTDTSEIARVWDAETGQLLLELSGHAGAVYGAAWSPDGTRIATASADKTAKIWDAVSGEELLTLYGHAAVVGGVAFSPDGTRLATMSDDGTVRVYLLKIEELIALAKSRVTRTLTTEECQKYLHVDTCPIEP